MPPPHGHQAQESTVTITKAPAAQAFSLHGWPLVLLLDPALGRAGLRLVAICDPDPDDLAHRPGRAAGRDMTPLVDEPAPELAARSPRVLLVDDNANMRRALRGLLEDAGVRVMGEARPMAWPGSPRRPGCAQMRC
jgi:hypothetical protein